MALSSCLCFAVCPLPCGTKSSKPHSQQFQAGLIPGPAVTWEGPLCPRQPLRRGGQAGSEHLGLSPVPSRVTNGLEDHGRRPRVSKPMTLCSQRRQACVRQDNSSPLLHTSPNSHLPAHQSRPGSSRVFSMPVFSSQTGAAPHLADQNTVGEQDTQGRDSRNHTSANCGVFLVLIPLEKQLMKPLLCQRSLLPWLWRCGCCLSNHGVALLLWGHL